MLMEILIMKAKRLITAILLATTMAGAVVVATPVLQPSATVSAAGTSTSSSHVLSKSYVVYGAGASNQSGLADVLGVTSNYEKLTTYGSDAKYLGESGVADSAMISSVAVAPAEPGSGVLVNIKDYNGANNITTITSQQYAMAATLSGVNDVIITVTANQKVSGEAALAGVYKALEQDGATINTTNTEAANSVMSATTDAIKANANDSSYPGKLTSAVTETASDVAKEKQSGTNITVNVIVNILNTNLEKQGIADQTSDAQVTTIATALKNVADAPISDSKSFVNNAKSVANKLEDSAGDIMAKAKDFANSEDVKKAANWFMENIWDPFTNWLGGLFS
jgi:uncharacterized protein YpuA (DUF1002 family)